MTMANYDNNITTDLGDILTNKRGSEWVRVSKVTGKDGKNESFDVRLWYIGEDNEEHPTHKGFRMKSADVVGMLTRIYENLKIETSEVYDGLEDEEKRQVLAQYKAGGDRLVVTRVVLMDKNDALLEDKCIDIRKWYYDDNDELQPTKKGIRLKGEVLAGVIGLLNEATKEAQSEAFGDKEEAEQ